MRSDIIAAFRGLAAARGTSVVAFLVLTMAISAATVTFSVVDTIALRPLALPAPDRLVAISRLESESPQPGPLAPQDVYAWQTDVSALQGLAAVGGWTMRLQTASGVQALTAWRVTPNLFDVLQVRPALGAGFSSEHEDAGAEPVAVISHACWQRHFGGDAAVVGSTATFGKETRRILGVMPEGFTYPIGPARDSDVWIPYVPRPSDRDHAWPGRAYFLQAVGRLRDDATIAVAQAQVQSVIDRLVVQYPGRVEFNWKNARPLVQPLHDRVVGPAAAWLRLVLAAVVLVLFVACANVASLLLARASARGRELATRAALGASRGRLARMLLFEGLLLSSAAAAAGVTTAIWGLGAVTAVLPAGLARAADIALDTRVLAVSVTAALLTGLVFAAVPAWQALRTDLVGEIKDGAGAVIGGRRRGQAMRTLLGAEVAFVVTVLVAVGLFVGSFVQIVRADLGFDRRQLVGFAASRSLADIPSADRLAAVETLTTELVGRVRALPGVRSAAFANSALPLASGTSRYSIRIDGRDTGADMLELRAVTAGYFDAMGMRIVEGRPITADDRAGAPAVAVITQEAARRFFPGGSPLRKTFDFRARTAIVGVVADARFQGPESEPQPQMFLPLSQNDMQQSEIYGDLIVRIDGAPAAVIPAVSSLVQQQFAMRTAPNPAFVDEAFRRLTAARRFNAGVMTVFGAVALVIGAIGIYGVTSFAVAQQVRAIGLRMALGASRGRIMRDVLAGAAVPLGLGTVAGLLAAWSMSGMFTAVIFGIRPAEGSIYAIVAATAVMVGLLATTLPGLRAVRVDPSIALRS